jgi:hypothetical protein
MIYLENGWKLPQEQSNLQLKENKTGQEKKVAHHRYFSEQQSTHYRT